MNTELEVKFIQILKCGLLDKLTFTEGGDGRVAAFEFCYDVSGHELTASYGFREEEGKLLLIIPYYFAHYNWGKYICFRTNLPKRTDIHKVDCTSITSKTNVEYLADIRSFNQQNIERSLLAIDHDIWDSTHPIIVKEKNYLDIDWSKIVAYNVDHPKLTAIDSNGNAYEYVIHLSKIVDEYLKQYLGEAFSQLILPRGLYHWPDQWDTYKRSNGHCLYIRKEYSERLPADLVEIYRAPKAYYEILTRIVDMVLGEI